MFIAVIINQGKGGGKKSRRNRRYILNSDLYILITISYPIAFLLFIMKVFEALPG